MIRATYMTGTWYGTQIESVEEDLDNINCFIEEGTPVLLLDTIEDTQYDIEMVEE